MKLASQKTLMNFQSSGKDNKFIKFINKYLGQSKLIRKAVLLQLLKSLSFKFYTEKITCSFFFLLS